MFAVLIIKTYRFSNIANFMKKITLGLAGDNASKNALYLIDNNFCHGVDACSAVNGVSFGCKTLPFKFYSWVLAL